MFKPHEIHDQRERIEVENALYLKSPELRQFFRLIILCFAIEVFSLELNDLLHQAAFKGGLSRPLSISSDMMNKLSHRQVNQI